MKEIIGELKRWKDEGKAIALATIVETRGSSLRPAGTRMAINSEGEVAGSVSSGCVDGEAVAEMEAVLSGDFTLRRPFYGISDELAWGAGLSCGGAIDVLVERWEPIYDVLMEEIEAKRAVGFASRTDKPVHLLRTAGGEIHGTLGDPALDEAVVADLKEAWPGPYGRKRDYEQGEVFVEVVPPPPTLLIFGATDIAVPLAKMAQTTGYEVVVSDARRAFLKEERFPEGIDLRFGWPQDIFTAEDFGPGWAIVVLFHDPKFDIPALTLALQSEAYYIGFLGSKKTQSDRREELLKGGFGEEELSRIYGPVGLNIGGKDPAHIALSILAEVTAVRHRREGGMMSKRGAKKPA
jgi:xanthine dehydrogenase accessory factor